MAGGRLREREKEQKGKTMTEQETKHQGSQAPPPRLTSWGSSLRHPQADPGPHLLCARRGTPGRLLPRPFFHAIALGCYLCRSKHNQAIESGSSRRGHAGSHVPWPKSVAVNVLLPTHSPGATGALQQLALGTRCLVHGGRAGKPGHPLGGRPGGRQLTRPPCVGSCPTPFQTHLRL